MSRRKKGLSSIIAAIIIFGILFTTVYGFYYASDNAINNQSVALKDHNKSVLLQGQENLQVYGTLGTEPTTTLPDYVPITLYNAQSAATPAPFQQLITFNPSSYSSYESASLGNIRFCANAACTSVLYAWLESCSPSCASSATSANVWVNLPSGISAGGSVTIYMAFMSTGTIFDGVYWGEAPQLSSTYGIYDNGAKVFTQYGGASWSAFTFQSGTWSTTNGYLSQTSSAASGGTLGGPAALIENTQYSVSSSYVLEMAFSYTVQANARVGIIADGTPFGSGSSADTEGYRFIGEQASNGAGYLSFLNDWVAWKVDGTYGGSTSTAYTMQIFDSAGTWSGNLYSGYATTGTALTSLASTAYTTANNQGATSGYIGISAGYYTGSQVVGNPLNIEWFRMRAYPPSGVMPTVSFGYLNPVPEYVAITLTNAQTSSTASNFQQLITFTPSSYASYEASNLGNIRFCTSVQCSTILDAWLESCTPSSCSSTASAANVWVKLPTSIGAGGSVTIYMVFLPTSTNFDGVYWGEAPQLSSTYAQYDNGGNVFTAYFNGNTATTSFSAYSGVTVSKASGVTGPTGTSINAIDVSGTSGAHITAFVYNAALSNVPMVSESSFALAADASDATGLAGFVDSSTASGVMNGISDGMGYSSEYFYQSYDSSGTVTLPTNGAGTSPSAGTWAFSSVSYPGTGASSWSSYIAPQLYSTTGGYSGTVSNNPISSASNLYLGAIGGSAAYNVYFDWMRARLYPPSGIMPSVSFGNALQGTLQTQPQANYLNLVINDTGPAISVVAYWILAASSSSIVQYENASTTSKLPMYVGEGQSGIYTNTNITVTGSPQYVIKVLTSRGSTAAGTYPSQAQAEASLVDSLASGIGSFRQTFSSFDWYSYISGPAAVDGDSDYINLCSTGAQCNGGTYLVNLASPEPAAMIPQGQNSTVSSSCSSSSNCGSKVPLVLAINMTNNDPNQGTIVLNSETNLWIVETCDAVTVNSCPGPYQQGNNNVGPQGNEMYVFYIVNINQTTGAITSLNQGSFVPISIPYGTTTTLYFAAAFDLSQASFSEMSVSSDDSLFPGNNQAYYGEFAAFLLFSGTKLTPTAIQAYGQDAPFSTVISANNLATYSETPTIVANGASTAFSLAIANSLFSGSAINEVLFNATSFSSISALAPPGWTVGVSNGWITWTASSSSIQPGQTQTFFWAGTTPTVTSTVVLTMPFSIQWSGQGFNYLQASAACYVTTGNIYSPIVPNGVTDFVPITLVNSQNSVAATGTQVMLNVNWASYAGFVSNPVSNVVFFDYNGVSLNAWMENGSASSATNSIVWVKLGSSDSLSASGTLTIYMGFYPTNDNVLSASGPFGEAPQLSTTYAQYDDGASVFLAYFNGNTALTNFAAGSSITISKATGIAYGTDTGNAIHVTGTGTDVTVVYKATAIPNEAIVAESNFESLATPTSQGAVSLDDNIAPGSAQNAIGVDLGYGSSYFSNAYESAGSYTFDANPAGTATGTWNYGSITYTGPSTTSWSGYIAPELYTANGQSSGTETSNPLSAASNIYLSVLADASSSYPDNMNYNWMRARIYPPGGVMPAAIFGPVIA